MYQNTEQPQSRIEVEHEQAQADMSREFSRQPKPRNRINLVEVKYPNGGDVVIYGFWRTDGILSAYTVRKWRHTKVVEICLLADLEYRFEIDDEKTVTISFWRA